MKVYNIPGSDDSQMDACCIPEGPGKDSEKRFIEATAELVCEILQIGYNDKRIVQSLLIKGLSEKMDNRWKDPGFLQQYGASKLDEAALRFYSMLDIPKEVKVNHEHADHAKYTDIVSYILKNWEKKPELIEEEARIKAKSPMGEPSGKIMYIESKVSKGEKNARS